MPVWMLWKGILLGLGAAAPIGPVNVEIARRCVKTGFHAGFLVGCGAVTVDISYAILASLSFRPFLGQPRILALLGFAGALMLAYLAANCFASALRFSRNPLDTIEKKSGSRYRHYVTGLFMTALNPLTLAFWFLVVPGVAGQMSPQPGRDLPFICAGVFAGAFSWVCCFSALMSLARRVNKRVTLAVADIAGGVMLLGFAVYAFVRAVERI